MRLLFKSKLNRWLILLGLTGLLSAFHYYYSQTAYPVAPEYDEADTLNVSYPVIPVLKGKKHNPVMRIKLVLRPGEVRKLEAITLHTEGTSDLSDIRAIRVFKTEEEQVSSSAVFVGAIDSMAQQVTINTPLELSPGVHWFLVTCELNQAANLDHYLRATLINLQLQDTYLNPSPNRPSQPMRLGIALRQQGDQGVNTFRIPGLVTTNEGSLVAVYDIRYNGAVDLQADIDVGMSRSTDGGQTWEPMQVIMDMGSWGGLEEIENGIGDPSILVDRNNNTLWVAGVWAHGHRDERNWFASKPGLIPRKTSQMMLVKSEDDGLTWSEPINITTQVKDSSWYLLLQGPGKGITLDDGTLVFPAQFKDHTQVPHSTLIFSRDHGTTWQVGNGVKPETTEAQIVQLINGEIMINARNNHAANKPGVGRVVATSDDLGQSWTEHSTSVSALEEPTCMASLVSEKFEKYGELLLFSNPNAYSGRFDLTIKASLDQGLTWPQDHWLLLDEGHGRGYSCLTKIDEETMGILYESSQADLVFQRIHISDIMGN